MTPPRRPEGWLPYGLPEGTCRPAGRWGRRPYTVRRAVGAGHARPAASRNRPFTVAPQGKDSSLPRRVPPPPHQKPRRALTLRGRSHKNLRRLFLVLLFQLGKDVGQQLLLRGGGGGFRLCRGLLLVLAKVHQLVHALDDEEQHQSHDQEVDD